jgi:hypothetical protein
MCEDHYSIVDNSAPFKFSYNLDLKTILLGPRFPFL